MERFVQHVPGTGDVYRADPLLGRTLDRLLGEVGHTAARPALEALAADVAGSLRAAHHHAEAHPPELVRYDGWGARVDRIETSAGWETQRRAAARHGVVALPYEPAARAQWGAGARVVQHALLHLYGPESATFSCPVAMSDGAAAMLGAPGVDAELRDRLLPLLLSRDPDLAWTSGQWMTETQGGSDVSGTTTTARRAADGTWRLTGEKWFCSATDSPLAIVLARPDGAPDGSRGLACFALPRYADAARFGDTAPGIRVHRLKDKLGTRALASAEVGLHDALAWPVGDPGELGLSRMLRLILVTRLHNAAAAAGGMRRGLHLVRAHAAARSAFGRPLDRQPLHRETLGRLAVDADAAYALTALCFHLLGRVEVDGDERAAAVLRLANTLAKAATGKAAVASASEYVECFGGAGFIEDTGVPRLLRDAQVLPIWEGTTNVLSLDVVRALSRDGVLSPVLAYVDEALAAAADTGDAGLATTVAAIRPGRDTVAERARAAAADPDSGRTQAGARSLMRGLADLLAGAALLEQAAADATVGDPRGPAVADLWVRRRLAGADVDGAHDPLVELLVAAAPR